MKAYDFSAVAVWDHLGMTASSLCIAHCVATPVLLPLMMAQGLGFIADENLHRALVFVIMVIATLAFIPGYRKHGRSMIFGLVVVGLASLMCSLISETWEAAFTVFGGGMLVAAHWLNRSFCRLCSVCQSERDCCSETG